jgi:hypothetical protein
MTLDDHTVNGSMTVPVAPALCVRFAAKTGSFTRRPPAASDPAPIEARQLSREAASDADFQCCIDIARIWRLHKVGVLALP